MAEPLPQFVQRRRQGWAELEQLVARLQRSRLSLSELEQLDRLYRRAASDLAHARAFFPGSEAHVFLNQLCARAYAAIYRGRSGSLRKSLSRFFARDFPATFLAELRFLWASLGFLLSGALVGLVAALSEPTSVYAIVPEELRQHFQDGTLWTDQALAATTPLVLGTTIVTNNIGVALTLFGLGLTAGLGTATLLFYNGLHFGAVLGLASQAELGSRLLGFVAAHGFVEIAAVVIAGQAGLMLGASIVAPGDLSRADALRLRGRRALRLLLGTLPLFAVIGLVEGFVSPGSLFPPWVKLMLGASLGALFFLYLVRFGRAAPREDTGS